VARILVHHHLTRRAYSSNYLNRKMWRRLMTQVVEDGRVKEMNP